MGPTSSASRASKIAFSVQDSVNPYRYIQIRGQIISDTEEGAYESICDLKYHGDSNYPKRAGEVRVIYKVKPQHANTMGYSRRTPDTAVPTATSSTHAAMVDSATRGPNPSASRPASVVPTVMAANEPSR